MLKRPNTKDDMMRVEILKSHTSDFDHNDIWKSKKRSCLEMPNIAIIPARSGSKRIKGKNIKLFHGKPLISWSIQAAQKANLFDEIIVSTDQEKTADVARAFGATVPRLRPAELSDDHTPLLPVVQWTLNHLSYQVDNACLIYATAPMLQRRYLELGLNALSQSSTAFALSVTSFAFPVQRALRAFNGGVQMLQPEFRTTRSQDLEEVFHDAAHFCWGKREAWLGGEDVFGENTAPIFIPRHLVQDIDTMEDWQMAEKLFALYSKSAINKSSKDA